MSIFDTLWDDAVGGLEWLKELVYGEFAEDRPTSVIVADMLVSMTPGVVIITSARDLAAVCLRLGARYEGTATAKENAAHPEWEEWVILVAALMGIFGPEICAAIGSAFTLFGTAAGFVIGDEAAAVFRGLILLLIKAGKTLPEIVKTLAGIVKGNIIRLLEKIHLSKLADVLVRMLKKAIGWILAKIKYVKGLLSDIRFIARAREVLATLTRMEERFHAIVNNCVHAITDALGRLDAELQKVLKESLPPKLHPAYAAVPAPKPRVVAGKALHVTSGIGHAPRILPVLARTAGEAAEKAAGKGAGGAAEGTGGAAKSAGKKAAGKAPKHKEEGELLENHLNDHAEVPGSGNVHKPETEPPKKGKGSGGKGVYGEKVSDKFMKEELRYKSLLSEERQERLMEELPTGRGLDGVYEVEPEKLRPPRWIVTETKYQEEGRYTASRLPKTKGSTVRGVEYPGARQMSDKWIKPRLEDVVGRKTAKDIMNPKKGGMERWLMVVDKDGKVTRIIKLDENARAIDKVELKDGKVVLDAVGRPQTTVVTPRSSKNPGTQSQ